MANLHLPDRLRKFLVTLSTVPEDAVDEMHQTLSKLGLDVPARDMPDHVSNQLKRWDPEQARGVVKGLASVSAFRTNTGQSVPALVDDVLLALRKTPEPGDTPKPELLLKPEFVDTAKNRLLRLLTIPAFDVAAKALGVHTDHQRAFTGARILSDVRPVFSEDIQARPAGAVLVHSLKLEFMESNERKQFFVALDSADIQTMLEVLQRAKTKDTALRKLLHDSNVHVLDPK